MSVTKYLGNLGTLFQELGLFGMARQDPGSVAITGGSIAGVAITSATAALTSLTVSASTVALGSITASGACSFNAGVSTTTLVTTGAAGIGGLLSANAGLAVTGTSNMASVVATGFTTNGSGGGFSASDRSTSGLGVFYRTGGVNRLWDSAFNGGADVITYNGSGAVGMAGALTVVGATTLSGGLSVSNSATFANNLTVASTGTLYANGPLAVTGTAYLNGSVQMNSNATVAGTLGITGLTSASAIATSGSSGTFGAALQMVTSNQTKIVWTSTGGATDNRSWQMYATPTFFALDAVNDANSVATNVFSVSRSVATSTSLAINSAITTLASNATYVSGTLSVSGVASLTAGAVFGTAQNYVYDAGGGVLGFRSGANGSPRYMSLDATGTLNISNGGLTVSGSSLFYSPVGVNTTGSTAPSITGLSGQVAAQFASATTTRLLVDSIAAASNLMLRSANGTAASPTASTTGQNLGVLGGYGYGATGYSTTARAKILFVAAENWTDSAQGAALAFQVTPVGTTTTNNALTINQDASLSASNSVTATAFAVSQNANGAFIAFDRSTGNSGNSQFYRSGGVTALWDNTYGNCLTFTSTGAVTIPGTLNVQSNGSVISNLVLTGTGAGGQGGALYLNGAGGNAGIEMGSVSAANTPYIDFHSSGYNNDYDFRIIVSGGTSSGIGTGALSLNGGSVNFNCTANFNAAVNTTGVASGLNVYDRTPSNSGLSALYRQSGITYLYDSSFANVLSYNAAGLVTLYGALQVNGASTHTGAATFNGSTVVTGGQLNANAPPIGTTANTKYRALTAGANDGNVDSLVLLFNQSGTASNWTTVNPRIQRIVDSTLMGYVEFGDGTGNSQVVRIGSEAGGLCATFTGTQTILFGALSAPGMATFNGGITVNAAALVNSTLGVTGALTASGGIYTLGQISTNGANNALVVADRLSSNTGTSQIYRSGGYTNFYDSTYGPVAYFTSAGVLTVAGTLQANNTIMLNQATPAYIGLGATVGWYHDSTNLATRTPSATGNLYIQGQGGTNTYGMIGGTAGANGTSGARFPSIQLNGAGGGNSSLQFYNATNGTDLKYLELYNDTNGSAVLRFVNDAYNNGLNILSASRASSGGTMSVTGITTGTTPYLQATGGNVSLYLRNTGDSGTLAFMQNTFVVGYLGISNYGSSAASSSGSYTASLAANASQYALCWTTSGAVGSVTNTNPNVPVWRNMLDDGAGNLTTTGYHSSSRVGAQFLGNGYAHYSDSSNYYLLLTGSSTPSTSFNGLRPLYVNLASGLVSMQNGLSITGGAFSSASTLSISTGAGAAISTTSALSLQMNTSNSIAIRDVTNGASTMYFDVSAGGSTNGGYVWRSSNNYTTLATLNSGGLTVPGTVVASSLSFSGSSFYAPGCIYTDANWGVIIRAYQANPVAADFDFQNSAGTSRLRLTSSTSTLSTALSVTGATTLAGLTVNNSFYSNVCLTVMGNTYVGPQPISTQGAYLMWNHNNGDGASWIINQRGGGAGGVYISESTTGNALTTSIYVAPAGGTSFLYSNLNMSGYAITNSPSIAKAWVYFNYQGTIISSYNVSSVTVNTTGQYTINFPSGVFADANYSYVLSMQKDQNSSIAEVVTRTNGGAKSTTAFQIDVNYASGGSNGAVSGGEFCAVFHHA